MAPDRTAPGGMDTTRLAPPAGDGLIVTGGCGGIGTALVRAALENGLKVAIFDLPKSIAENPPPAGPQPYRCGQNRRSLTFCRPDGRLQIGRPA